MRKLLTAAVAILSTLGGVSLAHGQRATELYIPIGASPGVSGIHTLIGPIEAVDAGLRTLRVGGTTVAIADTTEIWLDRSARAQSAATGSLGDCAPGRTAEVKLREGAAAPVAEWVKVRPE